VFDPKTSVFASKRGFFDPNIFPNFFREIFANSEKRVFPNFQSGTILKLAKMKNSENSVFRRTLILPKLLQKYSASLKIGEKNHPITFSKLKSKYMFQTYQIYCI
jgi:hypothetical protein